MYKESWGEKRICPMCSKQYYDLGRSELELGIENFMLSLSTILGIIDSDPKFNLKPPFIHYLSEIAFIELGDATITGIPGELYPEIAVGGIENPQGADYSIDPQEVPHLRSQLPGKLNLMVNLANDAIGYIIPKSEWDEKAPWIFGENEETGSKRTGMYKKAK